MSKKIKVGDINYGTIGSSFECNARTGTVTFSI